MVEILRDISIDVTRGETLGLIGPSGSGKSSLLMLMGGLEQVTSGNVSALGHDLTAMNEDALARFRRHHMGHCLSIFPPYSDNDRIGKCCNPTGTGRRFRCI